MRRRLRILLGGTAMALVLSSCTVLGPYPNHGQFACFLQVGPGEYPNVPLSPTVFPIVGELVWEVCYPAD